MNRFDWLMHVAASVLAEVLLNPAVRTFAKISSIFLSHFPAANPLWRSKEVKRLIETLGNLDRWPQRSIIDQSLDGHQGWLISSYQ
ncbi:hypothetical protein B0T20DRAFT_103208 [Sordaria brevicollis]|uniref:Uncharacterized protein n=1 Tax=Sordaria brevicollis TaxID=83679 RepID=A0AAE0NV73_SORBR|nr:hypothetical protein B0T20DRAFT_103208 [Sordaria brevicollis]